MTETRLAWLLVCAYGLIALLPLLLATLQGLPPRPFLDDLASGLALVGFSMLLLEFLLSGRFKGLSALVGMDRVMQFHQLMAWILVALLVIHPFLYYLPTGATAGPMQGPATEGGDIDFLPSLTGWIAWFLLLLLVFTAAVRDDLGIRYETWRASHGIGAVLIALLGLHHTLEAGHYSGDPLLATVWSLAVLIAIASLIHVHLLIPLGQRRHPYRVGAVEKEADRTWTLMLEPDREAGHPGTPFPYLAGQFVWLRFQRALFRITEHPFSLSSAPSEGLQLRVTIKEAGDFTNGIRDILIGSRVYLDGPYGNFTLQPGDIRPLVLIGGGVGMAPLMALLRDVVARGVSRHMRVIQGNNTEQEILYREELADSEAQGRAQVHQVLAEPPAGWQGESGFPDGALLTRCISESERDNGVFYVCGPPAMIDAVEDTLLNRFGIAPERVICERFRYTLGNRRGSTGRLLKACLLTAGALLLAMVLFALR
ncbi:ferredoxin reductase family protein [Methylonatrum kenyense]|uniref:ferredoxin reductase family protein n=1 Tax=Methylonatrum kenyense TaxID=455253 RepID=UPI0020BEBB68|nr:ferredoxin reductase family protein [Methylonatrum kenyense]MCK8516006.1 ferredoxin reductase family protein [Methylonatrum kenyense]